MNSHTIFRFQYLKQVLNSLLIRHNNEQCTIIYIPHNLRIGIRIIFKSYTKIYLIKKNNSAIDVCLLNK